MSSWCYTEIGISVTEEDLALKQQYMDCLGLLTIYGDTYNHDRCGYEINRCIFEEAKKEDEMIFGEYEDFESIPDNLNEYYFLLNLLFPHTYLYCLHYRGSSVTCERECEEIFYDPKKLIITKEAKGEDYSEVDIPDYCSGFYHSWEDDEYLSVEEYNEMCIKQSEGNLETNFDKDMFIFEWDGEKSEIISLTIPSKSFLQKVIAQSTAKGYVELTALILEKCKDI